MTGEWMNVEGLRMYARTSRGRGPAIVLVHGFVISSRYMTPLLHALAPHASVFAPDLPGFGQSEPPERVLDVGELAAALKNWMDAMGLDSPVMVGNSFGCQIIAELAMRHPERASCLVLTGPTIDRHARSALVQLGRILRDWPLERSGLTWRHLRDDWAAGAGRIWGTLQAMLRDRIEEKLPHVQAQTLVVRGSRDPIAPRPWCEEVASLLPAGQFVEIPDAPHGVNFSSPEPLARLVLDFVRKAG